MTIYFIVPEKILAQTESNVVLLKTKIYLADSLPSELAGPGIENSCKPSILIKLFNLINLVINIESKPLNP